LIVDISDVFEQRMESIKAYVTQFHTSPDGAKGTQTYISTPDFLDAIVSRARLMGKRIGVKYGEGFISQKNIGISHLEQLVLNET
jgi:hypothetical protein